MKYVLHLKCIACLFWWNDYEYIKYNNNVSRTYFLLNNFVRTFFITRIFLHFFLFLNFVCRNFYLFFITFWILIFVNFTRTNFLLRFLQVEEYSGTYLDLRAPSATNFSSPSPTFEKFWTASYLAYFYSAVECLYSQIS